MFRLIIILLFLNTVFTQDGRSIIFNTGSPEETEGFLIDNSHSVANRFIVNNNYVLEAMAFYVSLQSETGNVTVSIREDNNNTPGELVSDLSIWDYELDPFNANFYNVIVTTDLCIYLDAGSSYWWMIESADEETEATWIYKQSFAYLSTTSEDAGNTWTNQPGYAGAGAIWAEQIYENANIDGDVNSDFLVNVIDVVSIVGYVTGNTEYTPEQILIADLDNDGLVNVIDIVALVNIIITPNHPNADFSLVDINPASEFHTQEVGPSFFNGQVSCYYFGKQG
tara:strand:+ start:227 stop:1072 length:846 start_codon:yes stop_codon:yes gene_type:complete